MIQGFGKLLPSVPSPAALKVARECAVCDSTGFRTSTHKLSRSGSASCTCEASDGFGAPASQSVFRIHEDEDDWEFAGDEEKEDVEASAECSSNLVGAIAVPNLLQLSLPLAGEPFSSISGGRNDQSNSHGDGHVDEELGQSRVCDWLEPPSPCGATDAMQEIRQLQQMGGEGVMLEAFQQFQHNPQIQEMVVALATDARVWRAVLANKKLQEYTSGNAEGDVEFRISRDGDSAARLQTRGLSNFVLVSHNSLRELKECFIRGVVDVVDKRLQAETRQLMLDVMVRAFTMMSVFMLTLVSFLFLLPLQASRGP